MVFLQYVFVHVSLDHPNLQIHVHTPHTGKVFHQCEHVYVSSGCMIC